MTQNLAENQIDSGVCKNCEAWPHCAFVSLTNAELDHMALKKESFHFGRHQFIFKANTKPKGIYCLRNGLVKLSCFRPPPERAPILHIAQQGEILGAGPILLNTPHLLNAETIEETTLCLIETDAFLTFLDNNPKFARELLMRAFAQLSERNHHLCRLAGRSVRERIAEVLLFLKEDHGKDIPLGVQLDINLSRHELAQLTGTVHESVVRALRDFKEEKLIDLKGRKIVILDEKGLQKICGPAIC